MDLRTQPRAELVARAERALGVALLEEHAVCKRRSLGLPSTRETWVRICVTPEGVAAERGGVEATASLPVEVRHPQWFQSASWADAGLLWRVDETELVTDPVIQAGGGVLRCDPELPDGWWQRLRRSLTALATVSTARVATPHTRPITQQRVDATVNAVFPDVDTTVRGWTVAHADLSWVNLTAPTCRVLDWEDFGLAPRGFDAAVLWVNSLAVPALERRVGEVLASELESRTGRVSQLYVCAELIAAGPEYAGPLAEPVRAAADRLVSELRRERLTSAEND